MPKFSRMVSTYVIFNRTGKLFEVLSRKRDGYGPRVAVNDLSEAFGPVREKEEVESEV